MSICCVDNNLDSNYIPTRADDVALGGPNIQSQTYEHEPYDSY
jgi:hypothetical protein